MQALIDTLAGPFADNSPRPFAQFEPPPAADIFIVNQCLEALCMEELLQMCR